MTRKRMFALLTAAVLTVCAACGAEPDAPVAATQTVTTTTTAAAVPEVYAITATSVFVRSGPSTDTDRIGSLFQGDVVDVLGFEGDWCRIRYDGGVGYVHKDYVGAKSGTTATQEVTTTTSPNTTSPKYDDRYIDAEGLLQFKTDGHYVQSASYANGAEIPWNLRLVNDWNPMPKGYDEALNMVKPTPTVTAQPVDARMKEDLEAMLAAGKAYNIGVQSAYRSAAKQGELYWRKVNEYKGRYSDPVQLQSKAGEVVKRPGYSEHNLGLAVDLYGSGDHTLTSSFANTAAYKWLIEHCADYGFILRFPKGKESVTGVIYEAWHFRYVGDADIAHEIMDNGLCLEEYLEQTRK
ncbi:MAG: D-alanyl-D-alanine carboxypeptidase family protein [Clostridia bacterium]|nr:D-alanyl-D-alanine carboxypeptidase family protein [Clostridia bacterium]